MMHIKSVRKFTSVSVHRKTNIIPTCLIMNFHSAHTQHSWDFTHLEIDSARWLLPFPPDSQQLFNRSEHAEIDAGAYYSSMKDWQRSLHD